jgi:Jacalin-like lectin domain
MKKMKLPKNLFRVSSAVAVILTSQPVLADACQTELNYIGPSFADIAPARNTSESVQTLPDRVQKVLTWYSIAPLPKDCREPGNSFPGAFNTKLDSRTDVVQLTNRTIARILLKLDTTQEANIFLAPNTKPISNVGTSMKECKRVGDYDFSLVDLLRLYYVAKEHDPGNIYFSAAAREVILRKLLNTSGRIDTFSFSCLGLGLFSIGETENHILSTQISRYLTNQLLYASPPKGKSSRDFDNAALGNNTWMLKHLAELQRDHFYEYNSRPYQAYTVNVLTILHSYADDPKVKLAAQNLLDTVSAWTAVGSNNMRRFSPFRRQPGYAVKSDAWDGDYEFERFAVLVGNDSTLTPDYKLPRGQMAGPAFALNAAVGKYRIPDIIKDLAIKNENANRYFVGKHDAVEIYSSSPNALISAGGNGVSGKVPDVSIANKVILKKGSEVSTRLPPVLKALGIKYLEKERGWSRPTIVIPTKETSNSLNDMLRFNGNRTFVSSSSPSDTEIANAEAGSKGENLCVAEGFACGLQLKLGKVASCENVTGSISGMTFYNCSANYGLYYGVYTQPCTANNCGAKADNYGFVEVAEASKLSFSDFKSKVEASNTSAFAPSGIQTYKTSSGKTIRFEIAPKAKQASIIEANGIQYDRDYENWPRARGSLMQSTTPGRLTIDSVQLGKRLIVDMTEPLNPRRFETPRPVLIQTDSIGSQEGGQYFDGGSSVIPGEGIKWIAISSDGFLNGISMGWYSGLNVVHGSGAQTKKIDLNRNEYIAEVTICTGITGQINYLGIKTTAGKQLTGGSSTCLPNKKKVYSRSDTQEIVAFYGKAKEATQGKISNLGVVMSRR